MAEFWSNNDRGYRIRLWIDQTSQNIEGNSSQVRVRLALLNTTTTFSEYDCSAYVDLNGQRLSWSGRLSVLSYNQTIMLIDQTITIGHNADGTKSFGFTASFSGSGGWSPGTLSIGGNTFILTTIPRSSSVSVGAGTIGSAVTINISRQSTSFKHTVRYAWGNKSGTIASNVDTSTTWTIPLDFANDIPNSTSGIGTIYVDTYSGSTKTGTQSTTLTASVPASIKPIFSGVTLIDTNTAVRSLLTGNNFLQIISNIQVSFNGASGSYGSSITGYKAEIVGKNQTTNMDGGNLGMMNFNGAETIRASVVDSRGRWSDTIDVTINVIEYFSPILSFSALRTRETPNIIQIVRNAKIASITLSGSQKNIMTLSFKVAPFGSTTYTADNGPASGSWTTLESLTNSPANLAGTYPANKSFAVVGTLADKFTSVEFSTTISTEAVVMSYDKDGRVGIGKVVEQGKAGSLDVAGDIYAGGKQIQQHQLTRNDGRALRVTGDWNDFLATGFYIGDNLLNQPPFPDQSQWKYIKVTKHDDAWILQEAIDFNGAVSCYRVKLNNVWQPWKAYATTDHPMLQEKPLKTLTMGFPYGLNATLTRKDNLVTVTLNRRTTNIDVFEYREMVETIPSGYRPTAEVHMVIVPNSGPGTKSPSVLHFASDGKIRFTNGTSGLNVYTGTISYVTNDDYPS